MSRVPGGVVAVEEAKVQGLRPRVLHVPVLAGATVHLARGDETAVSRHLRAHAKKRDEAPLLLFQNG